MPKAVHDALAKVAAKYMKKGKLKRKKGESAKRAKDRFIYGTMANMRKRGEIE